MIFLILGILVATGLFVGLGFGTEHYKDERGYDRERTAWKLRARQSAALVGVLICLLGFCVRIPANHVGIVYSPFGGTKSETLSEGLKRKNPLDKIYKISTENQAKTIENLTSQTKDAQFVTTSIDIQYRVDSSNAFLVFKQYRTLDKMSDVLITPTTQRALELVTTKYDVIECLGSKRTDIYEEVKRNLSEELALYGVKFVSITINDMDAGDKIEAAITEEAVAKKAVETAEQNLLKAETEAKQKSVQAQAEQDAARIKAETKIIEAEAERESNEILNQSLSDELLRRQWIKKWDGKLPTYYGGDSNLMIGAE